MFEKKETKGKTNLPAPIPVVKPGAVEKMSKVTYLLKSQSAIPEGVRVTVKRITYTKPEKAKGLPASWIVPTGKRPEMVDQIAGLIVAYAPTRTLWDSTQLGAPPLCASKDAVKPYTDSPVNPVCSGCPMRNYQVTPAIEKGQQEKLTVPCKYQIHLMVLPAKQIAGGKFEYSELQEAMEENHKPLRRMVEIVLAPTSCTKDYPDSITSFFNAMEEAGKLFPLIPVNLKLIADTNKQNYEFARVTVSPVGEIELNESDPVIIQYVDYIQAATEYLNGRPATTWEEYMQEPEMQPEAEMAPEA